MYRSIDGCDFERIKMDMMIDRRSLVRALLNFMNQIDRIQSIVVSLLENGLVLGGVSCGTLVTLENKLKAKLQVLGSRRL